MDEDVTAARRMGRITGGLYLLSAVLAGLPNIYVSGTIVVNANAAATRRNVLTDETLFRFSIVSELLGALAFIFLAWRLYRLLSRFDETQARLMVTFVLISVPITFINTLNELAALMLFQDTKFASPFDTSQNDSLALLLLNLHGEGVSLANIFWGLWLVPFGILILKSAALPRIFGGLLLVNGFALFTVSLTELLLPAFLDLVSRFAIVPELGELGVMSWLLVKGIRIEPVLSSANRT